MQLFRLFITFFKNLYKRFHISFCICRKCRSFSIRELKKIEGGHIWIQVQVVTFYVEVLQRILLLTYDEVLLWQNNTCFLGVSDVLFVFFYLVDLACFKILNICAAIVPLFCITLGTTP
jgi:hypothetical protein